MNSRDAGFHDSVLKSEIVSGRPVLLFTKGVSMQPLLEEGKTRVLIIKAELPLEDGELALFAREDGQCILHRVLRSSGDIYYIRGDNCIGTEAVPGDHILGIVTEIHRKGKIIDVKKHKGYRIYVAFWNAIYPVRYFVMRTKWAIRRIFG